MFLKSLNHGRRCFYMQLNTNAARTSLLRARNLHINVAEWEIKPAEPNVQIVTTHWVPPELDDSIIIIYLSQFSTVHLNDVEHCIFDKSLAFKLIKTGIRRFKCRSLDYHSYG